MTNQTQNNNLNYLIDPTFTEFNRLFVLLFENENNSLSFSKYFLPDVQIKVFKVLIDRKKFFYMPIKNVTNILLKWEETKITQLICNLFDYEYFSKHYKLIAVDLSKEIKLENPDLKQQINFTGRAAMFFIIEKSEETTFKLLQNAATVFRFDYV